mmetsp:Transcript_11094/g.24788  ORF Transcript_11094/g.24788 Transcript_11094/m.24788 type:complete len:286 (-) Transcript_11094:76-933(-)
MAFLHRHWHALVPLHLLHLHDGHLRVAVNEVLLHECLRHQLLNFTDSVFDLGHLNNLIHRNLAIFNLVFIHDPFHVLHLWHLNQSLLYFTLAHVDHALFSDNLRHLHDLFLMNDLGWSCCGPLMHLRLRNLDDALHDGRFFHLLFALFDDGLRHLNDLFNGNDRLHARDELIVLLLDPLSQHPRHFQLHVHCLAIQITAVTIVDGVVIMTVVASVHVTIILDALSSIETLVVSIIWTIGATDITGTRTSIETAGTATIGRVIWVAIGTIATRPAWAIASSPRAIA